MLQKYIIITVNVILFCFQVAPVQATDNDFNQAYVKGISEAYGFILGQEYSLDRIVKKFPDLASSAKVAKAKFNASFPGIKTKIKDQLIKTLGKQIYEKIDLGLKRKMKENLGGEVLTKEIAYNFIQEVGERAEGRIDSPIIEYILSVKYHQNPASELIDGYEQRFSSEGHAKSEGVKLKLRLPKSWKAKEGERPHIVQKWVSKNGTGTEMILLDIRDNEGYTPTGSEIKSFVNSGEVKGVIPNGGKHIDSGVFSLEMQEGYWVEISFVQERAGIAVYQRYIMHQLFFRGKAIGLMCSASTTTDEKAKADEAFKRIKPLCQQVLNSLVLLQAY